MRGVRLMLDFEKTDEILRTHHIGSTLVVFGSARAREGALGDQGRWYQAARSFAHLAAREGGSIPRDGEVLHNVIATGGGPGVMEAANRGASEAGAVSIGFNISLPKLQQPNPYSTPSLTFDFHYFAMRKMHLVLRANALVVFPGGFGTLDELFEVLTLRQTAKSPPIPIVLFDQAYWRRIVNFDALVAEDMIAPEDRGLFSFAETPEMIWDVLLKAGVRPYGEPTWRSLG